MPQHRLFSGLEDGAALEHERGTFALGAIFVGLHGGIGESDFAFASDFGGAVEVEGVFEVSPGMVLADGVFAAAAKDEKGFVFVFAPDGEFEGNGLDGRDALEAATEFQLKARFVGF